MQSPSSSPEIMDPRYRSLNTPASSSRILYHVQCKVCHDHSSGKHYGIFACDGCAGFFKRSIRRNRQYVCKAHSKGLCVIDKSHRNQCRACRLTRCFDVGMNKDAVQHERGPRNSTIQRQIAIYKDAMIGDISLNHEMMVPSGMTFRPMGAPPVVLDLSMPRMPHMPRVPHPHQPYLGHPGYMHSTQTMPPTLPRITAEQIREAAAELLFKNVNWIKCNRAFSEMPFDDQILLLENSWKEFFLLALAENMMPMNFTQLLYACDSNKQNNHFNLQVLRDVQYFQDVLNQITFMNMDAHEYDGLRTIILFKKTVDDSMASVRRIEEQTCEIRTLKEARKITVKYEESRLSLINYIASRHGNQLRYGSLMHLIPLLKSVSSHTIEELFFRKAIGDVSIVQLILNLYTHRKI